MTGQQCLRPEHCLQGIGFLASICGFAWFSHVKMQQLTNSKDSGRFAVANMQHCSSFDPEGQHYLQAHLQEGEVVPCEPRLSRLRTHQWLCAGVKRDGKDEQKDQLSNLCKSLAWGLTWFALGACICLLSGETHCTGACYKDFCSCSSLTPRLQMCSGSAGFIVNPSAAPPSSWSGAKE